MFKTKLQELCQKRSWDLPKYSTTKQGLDHNPAFSATVLVNDQSFQTLSLCKSSKEAQNDAARLAFEHFSLPNPNPNPDSRPHIPSPSSFPQPSLLSPSGSSSGSVAINQTDGAHGTGEMLQQQIQETQQTPPAGDGTSIVQGDNKIKDIQHLYKSELQVYAQKRNLVLPVYSCERGVPPHASRFKCRVTIDGKTYESPEYFHTLKEAEHAAAKVALISLSPDFDQKDDSAFYKNLLQQLVQKEGLQLPAYYTSHSGEAHSPVFVSSVEMGEEHFTGEEAKTKKQAEMNAAKVAYNALKERSCRSSQIPPVMPSSFQGQEAPKFLSSLAQSNTAANLRQHIKPNTPVRQAEDRIGEYAPPSPEILHGSIPNVFPSVPSESRGDSSSSSPSPPNSSIGSSSIRLGLPYKRIITIYPANKPIPDGSTLLPIRDDNWVAFVPPEAIS